MHPALTDVERLRDLLLEMQYVPRSAGHRLSQAEFLGAGEPFEIQAIPETSLPS